MDTARLTRSTAILVGLLSGAVALGVGHLVAGLVGLSASPYLAVGNTAIDYTPTALKDFAVRTFGTYDKVVLLGGMAAVILVFVAVAGVLSRRRPTPGMVLIGVLGVIGMLAIFKRPDVGQLGPLAGAAALGAGVLAFGWLHAKAMTHTTDTRPERRTHAVETADTRYPDAGHARGGAEERADAAARGTGTDRRGFLVVSAITAGAAGIAGLGGQFLGRRVDVQASRRAVGEIRPAVAARPIPAGADFVKDGTPGFITSNADFYRVDTALVVPRVRAENWSLRVHGMVDRELELSFDDLRDRELVEKTITLTCVSNEVGGPYVSTANFVGVRLRDVLREAGVRSGADQLVSKSVDGWTAGSPTEVVMEDSRDALLAIAMNGEPLPAEHGFPVRIVVPGLYGYVSATKWLADIELTTFGAFDAYWKRRGWGERGPIKTMSRIDRPAGFQKVPGGRVVIAGVAWAQTTGIDAVEVRVDGGPWTPTTLSTEVNLDSWRMWRTELDLTPGGHTVECRATDRSGYTQTADRAEPIPDGATGWHSAFFTVG